MFERHLHFKQIHYLYDEANEDYPTNQFCIVCKCSNYILDLDLDLDLDFHSLLPSFSLVQVSWMMSNYSLLLIITIEEIMTIIVIYTASIFMTIILKAIISFSLYSKIKRILR